MTQHPPLKARDVRPVVPFVTPKVTRPLGSAQGYANLEQEIMDSMADALGVPRHLLSSGPSFSEPSAVTVERKLYPYQAELIERLKTCPAKIRFPVARSGQ